MSRSNLLGRLLLIIKALLGTAAKVLTKPWQKTLKILRVIGALLQLLSWVRPARESKDDDSKGLSGDFNDNEEKFSMNNDNKDRQNHSTTPTGNQTIYDGPHGIVPLDSSIACSLHPYPYIHNEKSRSSLSMSGVRAARSARTQAAASHRASRSSHNLGRPYLGTETWTLRSPGGGKDKYTFDIKSPEQPDDSVTCYRPSVRGYSMSSPDLGSKEIYHRISGIERQVSRATTTPPQSIRPLEEKGSAEDEKPPKALFHERIFPFPPDYFSRYDNAQYAEKKETKLIIEPMTLEFKSKPHPPGWVPVLHPEGVLYWYNEEKNVVTENELHDQELLDQVSEDLETIDDFISANRIQLPPNITLALELTRDTETGSITTDYYYADHNRRIIFFLDEYDAGTFKISQEVKGVTSLVHIRHELEAQYWHHIMLYPSTLPQVHGAASELKDLIFHYIADTSSSAFSTSPFDPDELYKLLNVVNGMNNMSTAHQIGAASFISRTMLVLARQKFYNWYGVPQRRLYRDQSVHGTTNKRTWLIKISSPLLFSAPDVHLHSLNKMWVDGLMHGPVWAKAIMKLNGEWQEFILYATVLLNANVAFIAIQSIDTQEGSYRSPVQVASYLSIVASIGCIVIGLLLVRQNRTRAHGTANDVCNFLNERSHPTLGLETLAILYSLPYAMLLWGMVSFLAAFAWNCFDATNIATRTVVGTAWIVLAALVVWCVWMGWAHYEMEADEIPAGEPAPAGAPENDRENAEKSWLKDVAIFLKKKWKSNFLALWHLRRTAVGSEQTQA
ncbi:hypothetical protein BKA70DRAFT_1554131 [Coprinopsis sp. MPI-PUGE-AT-0042]|nr:hypothetical protein BKA70DRAFT_1554131 [Coprinopsis sp. MPI-PUGE-AT-0042]